MTSDVIIRKQKIKIHTFDEQLALRVRKQLNDTLQYNLIAMMEKVFSQTTLSDEYLNIDRLKIDLGVVSGQDFEQHFIELVESKLINQLRKQLQDSREGIYTKAKENNNFYSKENIRQFLQLNTIKQQELTALLHFLQNGFYPWWYKKEQQKIPSQLLENLTEEETETLLLKMLAIKESGGDEEMNKIIERLFIHLPGTKNESIVYRLLSWYNTNTLTKNTEALIKNQEVLIQLFSISLKEFYRRLFQFLMTVNIENEENIIYNFINELKKNQKVSLSQLQNKTAALGGDTTQPGVVLKKVFEQIKETVMPAKEEGVIQGKQSNTEKEEETAIPDKEAEVIQVKQPNTEQNKETVIPDKGEDTIQGKRSITQQEKEGIYIGNTGLLLLHPFLQSFFKKAELLNEQNQFISIAARQKAAVLLYYLQCGSEEYKEWEMALNKIICGMGSNEIIPEDILIKEKEKEESKVLLETVVNYWTALKGASIEALQNTFLLREGKITWKEDYWLVQAERTGVDILLERLPWSYSTIKFPWLNNLIYTEW